MKELFDAEEERERRRRSGGETDGKGMKLTTDVGRRAIRMEERVLAKTEAQRNPFGRKSVDRSAMKGFRGLRCDNELRSLSKSRP